MNPAHQRAKPLPADDRRRAIVEAVIPLLLEKGSTLTSREMAEAAGVAEGTIFSVFPDKQAVIIEAVKLTMDPAPFRAEMAGICETAPLRNQLGSVAAILLERSERVGTLVGVLRTIAPTGTEKPAGAHRFVMESNAAILTALTELFDHHRDDLRVEPKRAAVAFLGFVFANAHPLLVAADAMPDAPEIVDMLLNGIAAPDRNATA
ncbi:MAG: TetR/AcrR family transcriptional regulator [Actinomycetota bacterium]|nr:TetR/AcrR family transcriptional regulator [Actinomycetota bacterium]